MIAEKDTHQHPCSFFPALRLPGSRRCGSSAAAGRAADSNLPSNLAGLADWARSPRSWSGGPGQDLVHAHIVEAVKDPVTEELVVGPGTETDVKFGTKRREKRRRIKAKTKRRTPSNAGIVETSKLD